MTAPLPSPSLSPMAGLFNAAVRYLNRRLRARNHELRVARDFAASDAAGYIDRTGLEA